jgi:hypothetical protein
VNDSTEGDDMYARIATYRGIEPDALDAFLPRLHDAAWGDVEGLEEVVVLVDRAGGTAQAITFFATEAQRDAGSRELERTVPMTEAGGVRTAIEHYEVALRERLA